MHKKPDNDDVLNRLISSFYCYKNFCENQEEYNDLLKWLVFEAKDHNYTEIQLEESLLPEDKEIMNFDSKDSGKTPPEFRIGDLVEVIVNKKNTSYHKGHVYKMIWHYKLKCWHYYICEDEKKISKRYQKQDLIKLV